MVYVWALGQRLAYRGHLDGFWSRADHTGDGKFLLISHDTPVAGCSANGCAELGSYLGSVETEGIAVETAAAVE